MLTSAQKREVIAGLVDGFVDNKGDDKLANVSQEEIDAYIVPLMSAMEDEAVRIISEKVADAFKRTRVDEAKPWWED